MTTRDEIMDRFPVISTWTWFHKPTRAYYRLQRDDEHGPPQEGRDQAFEELISAIDAALSDDWVGYRMVDAALHRPPPEPEIQNAETRWARTAVMVAKLKDAGVEGADEVRDVLPGWLTPMGMAVDGIVERIALHEGPCRVVIGRIKEKWGTLRIAVRSEPDDLARDISTIARWTETCTVGRCAVTGQQGEVVGPGWMLTLSPEMERLRNTDWEEFDRLCPVRSMPRPTPKGDA